MKRITQKLPLHRGGGGSNWDVSLRDGWDGSERRKNIQPRINADECG
jgi:hypothetical protein